MHIAGYQRYNYDIATNLQIDTNYEQTEIQQSLAYRLADHCNRVAGAFRSGIH